MEKDNKTLAKALEREIEILQNKYRTMLHETGKFFELKVLRRQLKEAELRLSEITSGN